MEIKTKYDVGQKVYIVTCSGFGTEYFKVVKETIRGINVGGKSWEQYDVGNTTRAERDIFLDLELAKNKAREKAKEHYEKNLKFIDEERYPELS